jgi:N-acetylglucosamine kinase-like BadF-type ATPase
MSELFIDAGQSAVRARLRLDNQVENWLLPSIDTSKSVVKQIIDSVAAVYSETEERPWRVSISSTALTNQLAAAEEVMGFLHNHGTQTLLLAHDAIGGYLSSLGENFGAVAAVGTGVVTLGVGPNGYCRVDGWGNIIGDAGSGFWIGRLGLDAAMRAHDGRGSATSLLGLMKESFPNLEEAYIELQSDPQRVSRIAAFAKPIIELAETDAVANSIVESAVHELSLSISTALRNSGFSRADQPAVSWTGSVARNPIISERLSRALLSDWPNAKIVSETKDPIDGVELMPRIAESHPIRSRITSLSV